MLLTTANGNGTLAGPELEAAESIAEESVARVERNGSGRIRRPVPPPAHLEVEEPVAVQHSLALFNYEEPGSAVTRFIGEFAAPLAERGVALHIFTRKGFELDAAGALIHVLGDGGGNGNLLEGVEQFTHRACNAFLKHFQGSPGPVTLMGCEWSAFPVVSLLHGIKNLGSIVSLHSLERERSDLTSEMSRRIEQIELSGLREARAILTHTDTTAAAIREFSPGCVERLTTARPRFPVHEFAHAIDAGPVKQRFQIGPLDPVILYAGDLTEDYGPDVLMRAMPAVLKKHPHARLIVVGDGTMHWPLRVYARYLLIEHVVRMVGHVEGAAMRELVLASDVVVLPSRAATPWWPTLAGWSAQRPVVATNESAPELLRHEQDAVMIRPEIASCAAAIDRILSEPELRQSIVRGGTRKVNEQFGRDAVAGQIAGLMRVSR